jgi:uncharacterized protein
MSGVRTPWVKICILDPVSRICIGFGRTPDEIGLWLRLSDESRLKVAAELPDGLPRFKERETA